MSDPLLDAYSWADTSRDPRLDALTITLIEPPGDDHLAALEPRAMLPGPLTIAEALDASLGIEDFAWGSVVVQTDLLERGASSSSRMAGSPRFPRFSRDCPSAARWSACSGTSTRS